MVLDRNENEPEEWDPEEEFYDPDSDGLTIPQVTTGDDESGDDPDEESVEIPSVSTSEMDAPDEIIETFWVLVLVINVAVLVASLGLMLVAFEGDLRRGGILLTAGFVLFGLAGRRYRRFPDDETNIDRETTTESDTEMNDTPTGSTKPTEFTVGETAETDTIEGASGDGIDRRPANRNDRS